jgi:hypothetical protein
MARQRRSRATTIVIKSKEDKMPKEEKLVVKWDTLSTMHVGFTVWGPFLSFVILLWFLDVIGLERTIGEHIGVFAKLIVDGYKQTN